MREIKFRAWTGTKMEYKIMAGFLGAFYVQGMDAYDKACMSPFNTIYPEQTPIMQHTGQHDKNGKEIYDSDFLKHGEDLFFIKWSDEYMGYVLDKKGWMFTHRTKEIAELSEMEIIGNLYENQELLKL